MMILGNDIFKFLTDQKDATQSLSAILASLVVISTFLLVIGRSLFWMIICPLYKNIKNFIISLINIPIKLEENTNILKNSVIPFMQSFQYEFTKNSGKSLKDQITRIEDNVKLAELRSRMVSD